MTRNRGVYRWGVQPAVFSYICYWRRWRKAGISYQHIRDRIRAVLRDFKLIE